MTMDPSIPPSIPPARRLNTRLGREGSRIPRMTNETLRKTQAIPASGTQTPTGRILNGFRNNDTGPVAVDMGSSAGSLTFKGSENYGGSVSFQEAHFLPCSNSYCACFSAGGMSAALRVGRVRGAQGGSGWLVAVRLWDYCWQEPFDGL